LVYASIALVIVAVRWLLGTLHVDLGVRQACLFLLITNFLYYRMCFLLPELALFSALLVLFYGLCLKSMARHVRARPDHWATALGITGAVLFATRPESLVIPPAVLVLAKILFGPKFSARVLGVSLGSFALAVGAISLWRFYYYGALLPNSIVAKS